jgi:drug/metabolite transporter (DMT)-like permease
MRVNLFYTALGVFVVISPLMPVVWVPPSSGDLALLCGVGVVGYLCLYFLDLLAGEAVISVSAPLLAVQALAESAASMLATHHVAGIAVELGFVLVAVAAAFVWFAPPTRKDAYSTQDSSAA